VISFDDVDFHAASVDLDVIGTLMRVFRRQRNVNGDELAFDFGQVNGVGHAPLLRGLFFRRHGGRREQENRSSDGLVHGDVGECE